MQIAVTGATGFIGRYLVRHLIELGHRCRCWYRPDSDRSGFDEVAAGIDWLAGDLGNQKDSSTLVEGCDAVVHAALYHPGGGFRGGEGDMLGFVDRNVLGTIRLIEAARTRKVERFVFVSTCAVHEKILVDRPLDETHPTTPTSHYGAHKAALEQFVHSYGWGHGYPISALRPTGVYGVAHPAAHSKWFSLVRSVARGEDVTCSRGGKEVHAADVAKAAGLLLSADGTAGEAFNCYDKYVSEHEVATIAKLITGSRSTIHGSPTRAKNEIVTEKLRGLGMTFGGASLLEATIRELVEAARQAN